MAKNEMKNERLKKILDVVIKVVLIIVIIILLIHNCELQKKRNGNKHDPNGNVDVIEIRCDQGNCNPIPRDNPQDKDITDLSFNSKNINIKVGSSVKLIPIIKPASLASTKLFWNSSDTSIATVDENGVVTGLKEGTVTITVTSPNGVSSTCVVKVTKTKVDVNNIIVEPTEVVLVEGASYQITTKVEPENATERGVIFKSSNPSIASVDENGVIRGLKAGEATITVVSSDGKVTATCKVIVVEEEEQEPEPEEDPTTPRLEVFDRDKNPVTWNGSNDLKIFSKSIYNIDGVIAPESENTYQFVVKNSTLYNIKYSIKFVETNDYHINMKYKLKKNDNYLFSNYINASELSVSDFVLNHGESDTYYLDWKWISSSNDTSIGKNPEASYGLKIIVEAESI